MKKKHNGDKYKILVVGGYCFDGKDATSITMKSLLGFLGPDRVRFILTEDVKPIDSYHYISISPKFFNSRNKIKILSKHRSGIAGAVSSEKGIKNIILNYIHTIASSYRSFIGYRITKQVESFIYDFRPDYIYSLLASPAIISLCCHISEKYKVPVIPHFMDDWSHVMFNNSILLFPAKVILGHKIKRVLSKAPFGLTISEKMANEYSIEYNKLFFPFMNSSPDMQYPSISQKDSDVNITYIGGLHINREKSICFLCDVLSMIQGYNFSVYIYTSIDNWNKHREKLSKYKNLKYGGFITHDDVYKIYNKADILLHVESFDKDIKRYTRLSISTKIPEYLSCSKPIIAIGPKDIASIEYLANSAAALTITNLSIEENIKKISDFLSNSNLRKEFEVSARKLYLKNHVQEEQRSRLDSLFREFMK